MLQRLRIAREGTLWGIGVVYGKADTLLLHFAPPNHQQLVRQHDVLLNCPTCCGFKNSDRTRRPPLAIVKVRSSVKPVWN